MPALNELPNSGPNSPAAGPATPTAAAVPMTLGTLGTLADLFRMLKRTSRAASQSQDLQHRIEEAEARKHYPEMERKPGPENVADGISGSDDEMIIYGSTIQIGNQPHPNPPPVPLPPAPLPPPPASRLPLLLAALGLLGSAGVIGWALTRPLPPGPGPTPETPATPMERRYHYWLGEDGRMHSTHRDCPVGSP